MEVTLSSKSWHNKLQSFVLRSEKPDLFSLCPYFWLTVFCMFAFVPIIFARLFEAFLDLLENNILMDRLDSWLDKLTPLNAYNIRNGGKGFGRPFTFYKKTSWWLFERWHQMRLAKDANFDVDKFLEDGRVSRNAAYEAKMAKEVEDKKKKDARKVMWTPMVKWTRRFINLAITAAGTWLVAISINASIMHWSWEFIKNMGIVFLAIGAIALGITIIYYVGVWIYDYFKERGTTPWLFTPFIWVGGAIGSFFSIFWEYFKANKNDYCPGINWD